MNKKIMGGLAVILFSIFALANSAFADFDAIYTVGASGSTVPKDSFGWDEQPWLYLDLPSSGLNVTWSWWWDPDEAVYYKGGPVTTEEKVWLTLDNWDSVRKLGEWHINAAYFYASNLSNPLGSGSTKFTVTPEPMSSVLFLIGGVSLAGFGYRRRKIAHSL